MVGEKAADNEGGIGGDERNGGFGAVRGGCGSGCGRGRGRGRRRGGVGTGVDFG